MHNIPSSVMYTTNYDNVHTYIHIQTHIHTSICLFGGAFFYGNTTTRQQAAKVIFRQSVELVHVFHSHVPVALSKRSDEESGEVLICADEERVRHVSN